MIESALDPHGRESLLLAPYASFSSASRGRTHPEPESAARTPFQRDRDRIIHCAAFRRLEYKTQVFLNHEGDHYRTRLTHTLEVAQIARAVARPLGLNEDLVEAIALSHDLGHPPFGHAGEYKLAELMQNAGGFNHNRQCLRVVTLLERRYPDFPGLNLTWEVREAMVKHGNQAGQPPLPEYAPEESASLEAELVDLCDSLAYANHDIDDGIRSGYLGIEDLAALRLWSEAEAEVRERWPSISAKHLVARTVSHLIDGEIRDLIDESRRRIERARVRSNAEARRARGPIIGFSAAVDERKNELHRFLNERLYHHEKTQRAARDGQRRIERIFGAYLAEPRRLPEDYLARVEAEGAKRVICDYIAGMTDRFCSQEYERYASA